jgi:hypothetical protein
LKKNRQIVFSKPISVIKEPYKGSMISIQANKLSMLVTPNHRIAYYPGTNGQNLHYIRADQLNKRSETRIPLGGTFEGLESRHRPMAQLFIAFIADGYHDQSNPNSTSFHLKKPRKIERLETILNELQIKYRKKPQKDGSTVISMDRLKFEKAFEPVLALRLNLETKLTMLKEIEYWDGSKSANNSTRDKHSIYVTTIHKNHALFYQYLAITSGWGCNLTEFKDPRNDSWSLLYKLNLVEGRSMYALSSPKNEGSLNIKTVDYEGTVFCLVTPEANFIVKHQGHVFVTGNSAGCIVLRVSVDEYKEFNDTIWSLAKDVSKLPLVVKYI